MRYRARRGFTLAELVVATTLIAVVMTLVYSAFHSSTKLWREGEQELASLQDVRLATLVMARELQSMVTGADYLFEGTDREFSFYTLSPPMDVREGQNVRVLWVRYRLRPDPKAKGSVLVREEAVVESGPPLLRPNDDHSEDFVQKKAERVKMGRKRRFDLASGITAFRVAYLWLPPKDEDQVLASLSAGTAEGTTGGAAPQARPRAGAGPTGSAGALDSTGSELGPVEPVQLFEADEQRLGWGRPQGMRIDISVAPPVKSREVQTFSENIVFRGPTHLLKEGEDNGPKVRS